MWPPGFGGLIATGSAKAKALPQAPRGLVRQFGNIGPSSLHFGENLLARRQPGCHLLPKGWQFYDSNKVADWW
jgi:hypothetical protein